LSLLFSFNTVDLLSKVSDANSLKPYSNFLYIIGKIIEKIQIIVKISQRINFSSHILYALSIVDPLHNNF